MTVAVPENAHIKMEIEDPDFVENRNIPGIPEENFEQALDRFEAGMRPEGSEDENQNQDQQDNEPNQILHEVPFYRDETGRKSMGHVPLIQVDTLKNHMDRYPKTKPTCMSIIYRYFFFLVNLFFIILGIIAIGFGIYGVIRVRVDGLDDPILICTDPAFVSLVLGKIYFFIQNLELVKNFYKNNCPLTVVENHWGGHSGCGARSPIGLARFGLRALGSGSR